jgi:16S rRNA (guanine966-N2)-methyltransferase
VRIIAGRLGGRQFDSPKSFKTHPMSDKIRGALFNMLGDIEGLSVLDAFAGSGALSFEAASRGAAPITAIDNDRAAQKIIAQNIAVLRLGREVRLISASANGWLETNPEARFDIVLCDPPYNDLQPNLLNRLAKRVNEHGVLVISWPGNTTPPELSGVELIDQRSYGDAQLLFYRSA